MSNASLSVGMILLLLLLLHDGAWIQTAALAPPQTISRRTRTLASRPPSRGWYLGGKRTLATTHPTTPTSSSPSVVTRRMVLSVPDSLIEETSTQALLDQILDESLRTSARRPIMIQFDPSSKAIWKQWKGTIFAQTLPSVLKHMTFTLVVYLLFGKQPRFRDFFKDYHTIWAQGLSVTTFSLTFFVNQSYAIWRNCLTISRTLQGKLNDLILVATACAKRKDATITSSPATSGKGASGATTTSSYVASRYTTASRQLLLVIARYIRLFNILSYAAFARTHRPLVTPRGMRRLVDRGLLTKRERETLLQIETVAATQRHNVVLQWIFRALLEGTRVGHFDDSSGFARTATSKALEIRAEANSMESVLRGRMPFAYAHTVQVLVDATLWMYPIMALSQNWSIQMGLLGCGFLTLCYQGLFDLAKRFLDPFHNENFWSGDDALIVDTLIAEINAGSLRWVSGLEEMPMSYQTMKKGDFTDFLLPNEGYTVEEAQRAKDARETEALIVATKLTPEQVEQLAAERLETAKQEYEETKLIMETPAGYDFVPGLDDEGESLEYLNRNATDTSGGGGGGSTTRKENKQMEDHFIDSPADEKYEDFLEAIEEDYETEREKESQMGAAS